MTVMIEPGLLAGAVTPPPSKSQAHRLLIARALAGENIDDPAHRADSQDIRATRDCLKSLREGEGKLPVLECGESGSTLRFLIPVALALRGGGVFRGRGRLMDRPQEPYFRIFDGMGITHLSLIHIYLEDLISSLARHHRAFYTCHLSVPPSILLVQDHALDGLSLIHIWSGLRKVRT